MPTPVDNQVPPGVPVKLDPRQTFASFVIGSCNRFAHAACEAVSLRPGEQYNPLFIHGGRALGKTHLATAIAHAVLEGQPKFRVAQLSADTFMRDLLMALRHDRMDAFKQHLRHVDLLIVDDVQLLAGRQRTQEEFFHTFNALHDQGRQIVLTSDRSPKSISRLEERLCNRFAWGLVVEVEGLDDETRVALLERNAASGAVSLPHDVAVFLASNAVGANVRDLAVLGAHTRARAGVTRRRITIDVAREVLEIAGQTREVGFDSISQAVCALFALRPADLRSRRRTKNVTVPRQLAMYLCRRMTKASYPQIGELFGRDHSTVMHATDATERRRKTDATFHATVEQLERHIRGE